MPVSYSVGQDSADNIVLLSFFFKQAAKAEPATGNNTNTLLLVVNSWITVLWSNRGFIFS